MSAVTIRPAEEGDKQYLIEWMLQPGVLQWFPLSDAREVEDAARIWISYAEKGAVLTALWDGVPCGITNLYLQPYKKLAHQCLFAIIVDEKVRGRGVGKQLLEALIALGRDKFHLKMIHLEVYEGNPAIHLYQKMGFKEYGVQRHFIKEPTRYLAKVLMQKVL